MSESEYRLSPNEAWQRAIAVTRRLGAARWARFLGAIVIAISLGLPSWAQVSTQNPRQTPPAQNAAAILTQAQQALDKNDFQHAATLLAEYLAQHPENAAAHFQLGYAYSNLKREADAAKEYARATELKPNFAEAHLNLGLALMDSDPAAAAASFKRAADLMPNQAKPRFLAGYALERSGDYAGAAAEYDQASALDAKSFDVFFSWGRALLRAGDAAGAEQRFRQALALRADSAPAHLGLANSLVEQRKADAAAEFTEYLKLQPADRAARLQLASLLYDSGKTVEALAELDRVDAGGPPSGESARLRASIAISQEQWDAAVRVLSPAVAAAPSDAVLHAELGHVLLEKKDYANARPELQKAITLDPKQTDVLRDLMDAEYLGGDCPAALQSLDELAQREAPKAGVWFVRATCYDKQQRIAEAASAYHKFLDMDESRNDKQDFQARERLKVLERQIDKKK